MDIREAARTVAIGSARCKTFIERPSVVPRDVRKASRAPATLEYLFNEFRSGRAQKAKRGKSDSHSLRADFVLSGQA